jgi:hypothetical protein
MNTPASTGVFRASAYVDVVPMNWFGA